MHHFIAGLHFTKELHNLRPILYMLIIHHPHKFSKKYQLLIHVATDIVWNTCTQILHFEDLSIRPRRSVYFVVSWLVNAALGCKLVHCICIILLFIFSQLLVETFSIHTKVLYFIKPGVDNPLTSLSISCYNDPILIM